VYGGSRGNYGGIPQTWEHSNVSDAVTGIIGDNDPVDFIGGLAAAAAQLLLLSQQAAGPTLCGSAVEGRPGPPPPPPAPPSHAPPLPGNVHQLRAGIACAAAS